MVSHFGSWKKKWGRIWLCFIKQGFAHWSGLAEREQHLFTSQLSWLLLFLTVFDSLFVTPKHHALAPAGAPGGVKKLWSPWTG